MRLLSGKEGQRTAVCVHTLATRLPMHVQCILYQQKYHFTNIAVVCATFHVSYNFISATQCHILNMEVEEKQNARYSVPTSPDAPDKYPHCTALGST